jgi:hypothetical protein
MAKEIKGLENNIPVRMVYIDTKEEVYFDSISKAARKYKINAQALRDSLNPLARKKFLINDGTKDRVVAFRIKKES